MSMRQQYSNEDAALLTLLRVRERGESWSSIANDVLLEKSASRLLLHKIDSSVPLHEVETSVLDNQQDALFEMTDTGVRARIDTEYARSVSDLDSWQRQGLNFVSVLSSVFPQRLTEIVDTPPFLFTRGSLADDRKSVSVVGSRHCTPRGAQFAKEMAGLLVQHGYTVVAGLAEGIDTFAHQAALAEGGRTVAFIGTGITRYYPKSNRLLQEEIEHQGLVLSQFLPDAPPTRQSFPMRNALMSGYGVASIIVEATEHSGTRSQARQAQHHARPIILSSTVVDSTDWGKEYAKKSGVYVVSTPEEAMHTVEFIHELNDFDVNTLLDRLMVHK